MKRTIIGAIVGGLLMFIWQFLSWNVIDLHRPAYQYTPNQDAILSVLTANLPEEGGYYVPTVPADASIEDHKKAMKESEGKPWASIQYHKSMKGSADMTMNMVRGFLSNVIMIWLLLWLFGKLTIPRFSTIFFASLAVGLITFINQPYTGSIWFEFFDTWAYLIDSVVSWALVGLWLGWWLNRRPADPRYK